MLAALLLALAAVISAGLALRYAWIFYGGVRRRHRARFGHVGLLGRSDTILALNDADVYASWRLARMNLAAAALTLAAAVAVFLWLRR